MKRLVLLCVGVGAAVLLFAYGPITVNIDVSTGEKNSGSDLTLSGSSTAEAAMRKGTEGDDNFTGTANRDFLLGLGGNDTLSGVDGKDVLHGSDGNDTIYGDNHGDYGVGGENGTDTLYGGPGDDVLDTYDFDEPATPDTVNCGGGNGDFVFHNPDDTLINCENESTEWFVIQDTP